MDVHCHKNVAISEEDTHQLTGREETYVSHGKAVEDGPREFSTSSPGLCMVWLTFAKLNEVCYVAREGANPSGERRGGDCANSQAAGGHGGLGECTSVQRRSRACTSARRVNAKTPGVVWTRAENCGALFSANNAARIAKRGSAGESVDAACRKRLKYPIHEMREKESELRLMSWSGPFLPSRLFLPFPFKGAAIVARVPSAQLPERRLS